MGILDGLLGQLGQHVDVANLAEKVGLDKGQVEGAIGALARAHPEPGDTAQSASAATGLPTDKLNEIIQHIGGEGSLAKFAAMIDRDGDGNPLDEIAGLAGGLFGKK
jgi:hypothetical protein